MASVIMASAIIDGMLMEDLFMEYVFIYDPSIAARFRNRTEFPRRSQVGP